MSVEVSELAYQETPRRRRVGHRSFTETTLDWFRLGEEIAENPVDGEYEDPPSRRPSIAIHAASVSIGLGLGLLAAWLVW